MKELQIALYIIAILCFLIAAFNNRISIKFEWLGTAFLLLAVGVGRL